MHWFILIFSGVFEAMWAYALAARHLRWQPRVALFIAGTIPSMGGLAWGLKEIPVGSGYTVWVAVGAVAALALGAIQGSERLSPQRVACVLAILVGVAGLQVLS